MKLKNRVLLVAIAALCLMTGCSANSPSHNYKEAKKLYEEKKYEESFEYFKKAISLNDDKAEYHIDYGMALIQQNEYEKAKAEFERVIMDKNIPMVLANNKKAYLGLGVISMMQDNYEEALNHFEKALSIEEQKELNTDLLFYESIVYERQGKTEDAIRVYSEILNQNEKDTAVYKARANAYRMMGEYEKSLADYKKALTYEKNDFDLYFGEYAVLNELGRKEEAKESLNKAADIKIDEDDDYSRYQMAKVQFYQNNLVQAENGLNYAISKGINEAYFYLGELDLQKKDYEAAKEDYLQYLKAGEKTSAVFYNQLITCCLNTDDLENVDEYIKAAKKTDDATVKYTLLRNEIVYLTKTGEFEDAYKKMKQYLKKYPNDQDALKDAYFLETRVSKTQETDVKTEEETTAKP